MNNIKDFLIMQEGDNRGVLCFFFMSLDCEFSENNLLKIQQ